MGKRRKVSHVAATRSPKTLTFSGRVYLQYRDDEAALETSKGDVLVYAECRQLHTNHLGEYEHTGFSGYFKVDIFDGEAWKPVILNELFPGREHHFGKKERSIDAYLICKERLEELAGKQLTRTYREHYELSDEEEAT